MPRKKNGEDMELIVGLIILWLIAWFIEHVVWPLIQVTFAVSTLIH